ncbi:hypothetical protein HRbin16_02094 [bacterium HR16]|nr:hypothetical protein HRbin16_02094 [bacterium HR16]
MNKKFRHLGIFLALCLSLLPSLARAQWDFFVTPDELVLPAGTGYYTVWSYLQYWGSDPIDIRFVSFSDGLVAVGVTVDDMPFYDWVFNDLTDLTLHFEPYETHSFPLFSIEVASDAPSALYTPTAVLEFDEIGGASGVALGASWLLEVQGAPVPEPATMVVLASGLAVLFVKSRIHRKV